MLRFIWILLLVVKSLFAVEVNTETTFNELLSHSEIYIDYSRSETIQTVQNKEFNSTDSNHLGFGYSPKFNVWIKFKLTNNTSETVQKTIEYNNPLTSYVDFFEGQVLKKNDGLLNLYENRMYLSPTLNIELESNESKVFFIKASSKITTLIIELNLWNEEALQRKELKNQLILMLFFGAVGMIILYNAMIFIATRDVIYFYYILFFATLAFHHLMYKGIASLYLFSSETMNILINYSSFIVALPTIFLALFTKKFLELEQYPKLNKILIFLLILYPITILAIQLTGNYEYRSLFFIIILLYLFSTTIYALIKKNKQAYFLIVAWGIFISSGISLYLSSLGSYNVFQEYPYYVEFFLILELIIFSLALASKIKMLQQEKINSEKKEFLLQELNHRIKNNMQIILSFIILQRNELGDTKMKEILKNLEHRIMATTHLLSLLHTKENISIVNMSQYFKLITDDIQETFKERNAVIVINSHVNIPSEYAVYCGLIVNEAVTNTFKYAFEGICSPSIEIFLTKQNDQFHLAIKDNGKGFQHTGKVGLGLNIIDSLATIQLDGNLNVKKNNGVKIDIIWEMNEK